MYNYFRVIIPRIIIHLLRLAKDIIDKHTADGASSKLSSLNMTLFTSVHTQAQAQHDTAEQLERDKEAVIMERNLALGIAVNQFSYTPNTVKYYVYSIRDFLLGHYKGREQLMGDYGYTVNMSSGNVTVSISRKPIEILRLANNIIAKDTADGASSILSDFDMAAFGTLYTLAQTKDNLAEKLKRDKKTAFLVRNQLVGVSKGQTLSTPNTLLNFIVSARDILLGFYKGREQLLGDWGYEVITTIPVPDPDPEPPTDTVIAGIVKAIGGTPIEGANITINTSVGAFVAVSSPSGSFAITLPDTIGEEETANIMVFKDAYLPYVQVVSIVPNTSMVFDFIMNAI